MKKERRGLRMREFLAIMFVLWIAPWWLWLAQSNFELTWRRLIGMCLWAMAATILTCVAESRLESRGRYVESGIDIKWAEIVSWLCRNGYKFSLAAVLFGCATIAMVAVTVWRDWRIAGYTGLVALNAVLAVTGKPTSNRGGE